MAENEDVGTKFKPETIHKILQAHFKDSKTKIQADAVRVSAELLHVFAIEGISRAARRAESEGASVVTIEHFEKILPQLLLDF